MAQLPPGILTTLDNYRSWKRKMLEYLRAEGLIGGVKGFAPDSGLSITQKNIVTSKAYREIVERLGAEVARDVGETNSAKALWKKLVTLGKNHALMRQLEEEKGKDIMVQALVQDMRNLEANILLTQNKLKIHDWELEGLNKDHVQLTLKIAECEMERLTGMVFDGNIRVELIRELGKSINGMVALAFPDWKVAIQQEVYSAYQKMKDEFPTADVDWQVVEGHLGFDIASWAPTQAEAPTQTESPTQTEAPTQLPGILTDLDKYSDWKAQMLDYLQAEGLMGGVLGFAPDSGLSGTQKNVMKDMAYLAIKRRLGDEVARRVAGLKTAKALWKKLDTLCKKQPKQPLVRQKGIEAMVVEMRTLETRISWHQSKVKMLNLELEGLMKEHVQLKSRIVERKMDSYN